ncbi:MAG: DUF2007 domain-containing protein [Bacteroidales bacterium]|nr:DUF2007 domain-containing protein [Bacteroidales bacterium]
MKKDDTMTVIGHYNNDFNANVALTKLHAAGIPAILNNETTANVFGAPWAPFDTIRLIVLTADAERARQIIADTEQ